jgi:endonuclease/exonuclease/phosphatase family metal-dependent hydrolase
MAHVSVASYNVHGGVDGWGRPFDVVDACRRIDADVLVLQEAWCPDGGPSMARVVADALGYVPVEQPFARGRIVAPPADTPDRWGPHVGARTAWGLRLDRRHFPGRGDRAKTTVKVRPETVTRGTWAIAVLSRLAMTHTHTIDLGQLPTDPARRAAIVVDIDVPGATSSLRVVGTHLAHLSQGSPRTIATLRRALRRLAPTPAALAGDMNLWGPPLSLLLPGWSRAVRGRTWPTWWRWPVAQSDHVLVKGAVIVDNGAVLRIAGSDHFPVRASLVIA